jgi:transposase
MSMGKREDKQSELFVLQSTLKTVEGHPFYRALEALLVQHGFDEFVQGLCQPYYAPKKGRPSMAPGVYFRCLLIGFFEGIDSERGIAWRVADSMSLRQFLGLLLSENTPNHSTLSRTRRLLPLEEHQEVFTWVLARVAEEGLVRGKTLGVDATTLEANAAMRSIVRRADNQTYQEFLTELAKADGIETPTREQLARMDRKRKKKLPNADWVNPHEPDAEITKMKDGRTHLAHKHEIAVDLDTGAIVGTTISGGATGDTDSLSETVADAISNLQEVREIVCATSAQVAEHVSELVADKGYHSNAVISVLHDSGYRTYIAEPERGRRKWRGADGVRSAVYSNRRRVRGARGKRLLRSRGELIERPFAHLLETGGMRRTHLRGHENILKRLIVHTAGFNLALVMRNRLGVGKPRRLQGRPAPVGTPVGALPVALVFLLLLWRKARLFLQLSLVRVARFHFSGFSSAERGAQRNSPFSTGC